MKTDEQIKQVVLKKVFADEIKKAEWAKKHWGLSTNPLRVNMTPTFSDKESTIWVKDDLPMGVYQIEDNREPEQSTFKFDLHQIGPVKDMRTKQVHITLKKKELMDIAKSLFLEKIEKAIDLTIKEMR